jgi:hypothetical protein
MAPICLCRRKWEGRASSKHAAPFCVLPCKRRPDHGCHLPVQGEVGGESFYEKQLQRDGWHLDEVEDDDLDFTLPASAPPPRRSRCSECIGRWSCGLVSL